MFQECKIKSLRPTVIFYLLSTDTDITRYYYAHVFVLGSPSDGLKTEIVFKRRLTNELLTTYLPSFLLLLMSYATTFFKPFYFEAAVTVNLSLLLVITTLFVRQVSLYACWLWSGHLHSLDTMTHHMIIKHMIIQCDGETPRHIICAHGGCLAHFLSTHTFYTGEMHMHICIS